MLQRSDSLLSPGLKCKYDKNRRMRTFARAVAYISTQPFKCTEITLDIVYQRERDTKNPLEPLLLKFAKEFSDDQDLSERLAMMYKVQSQVLPDPL